MEVINQKIKGNIVVDSISTLDMNLTNKSSYEGVINNTNEAKNIKITLDKNSKLILIGDSYISELSDEDETYSNIILNGYKLYIGGNILNK